MRPSHWMRGPLLLLALTPLVAQEGQTNWDLARFTWVKRAPAERGAAPNTHPVQLNTEALQALLSTVRAKVEGKEVRLFGAEELKLIAKPLSEALALAQPGEDILLLSTGKHDGGFMAPAEAVTARLFVTGGALNFIVHDTRLEFMARFVLDSTPPTFDYGSRKVPAPEQLQAPQATRLRPDWLAFPLTQIAAPVATAVPLPAPLLAPGPAAAPAPAPAATSAEDAAYEAKAQRLRTLKRLRDENLLSEAEYQAKREAILKAL